MLVHVRCRARGIKVRVGLARQQGKGYALGTAEPGKPTSAERVATAIVPTKGTPAVAAAAAVVGRVPAIAAEIPLEGIRAAAAALLRPAGVCTGGVVIGPGGIAAAQAACIAGAVAGS